MGAGMIAYAVADMLEHSLMLMDFIETPGALGRNALHWHFFFWDLWWLLGGLLFVASGRSAKKPAVNP
jgi:hypothetical protein